MLIHFLEERADGTLAEKHFMCLDFNDDSDSSNEGILIERWVYEMRVADGFWLYNLNKEQWDEIRNANLHRIVLVDAADAPL